MKRSQTITSLSAVLILGFSSFAQAQPVLIEDFEGYPEGQLPVVNEETPWTGSASNNWQLQVTTNANLPDNGQFLRIHSGGVEAYRHLPQFGQIARGETKTLFFQIAANGGGMSHHFGLTEEVAPSDWGDFRTQLTFHGGSALRVRDGGTARDVGSYASGSSLPLYNFWMVVDNDAGNYRVYRNQGLDDATEADRLMADGKDTFAFRSKSTGSLTSFFVKTASTSNIGHLDNLHMADGVDLTNPIPDSTEVMITLHPANVSVPVGGSVTFTSAAVGGSGARAYQWQVSTDEGETWTEIPNATGPSHTVDGVAISQSGHQYRMVALRGGDFAISEPAILLVSEQMTLILHDGIQTHHELHGSVVQMTGRAELHITSRAGDPIPGSEIHLDSPEAWLFLGHVRPSVVNSTFLGRVRVNGSPAENGQNVRVVQHGVGTVVIPHAPDQVALEVYRGTNFQDGVLTFRANEMAEGLPAGRRPWGNAISSFRLKRGHMAVFAVNADGGGFSRVYVAADGDLEVGALPPDLDNGINFARVVPWRWAGKKGYAGAGELPGMEAYRVKALWFYNWNNNRNSSLDMEYVPIRQTRWWPDLTRTRNLPNVTHVLGFNEPDRPDQANMTVATAIQQWPSVQQLGLRLGSPAPSDGGLGWLYDFMDEADDRNYRVDYVVVHFYRAHHNATGLYNFLRNVHLRTGRPIWLKEFNNGANWTAPPHPTFEQNAQVIRSWIEMMDTVPWIERYSIYSWVMRERQVIVDGELTPMGIVYLDHESPIGYRQEVPAGNGKEAHYRFEGDARDSSAFANHAMRVGVPGHATGPAGSSMVFNGRTDWLQLPPNVGNSGNFTFAAWVKWDGGGNWQRIFDFGDGDTTPGRASGRYLFLTPRSGAGTLRFAIRIGDTEQRLNAPALTPGIWTHVAVTIGDTARLFVNGSLVANAGGFVGPIAASPKYSYLGKSQFPADPLFAGQMADVRILDRELPAEQILELATIPVPALDFHAWSSGIAFPPGQAEPHDDPDGDGFPNIFEFLFGGDPLVSRTVTLPAIALASGADLGPEADGEKNYLTLQIRMRKERAGVTLIPQAAATVEGLSAVDASGNVRQAGPPVEDGDFEILTFYFVTPIEDILGGKGFIRLNAVLD